MKEMTFTEHLEELRKTLIRVVMILGVSFMLCYGYGEYIAEFLLRPLRNVLEATSSGSIVYLGLLDKVMSQLQVAFWTSLIVSSPLWFIEVWRFIKPGLYSYEVKAVKPFLFIGFIFFCLGIAFGYFLVFPLTFETLMSFGVENVKATISLKDYLILASKVLVFLGLVFQLPNILLILGFMGIVTKYSLRSMRRYVYVGFAVVSAFLTPPDPYTLLALWFPLIMLYEVGILIVALIVHPYLAKQHSGDSGEK
jgi:sec-independent protein translocase protein TatC